MHSLPSYIVETQTAKMELMTASNSQLFTQQTPAKLLWHYSVPMVGAILALFAYDLLESALMAFQSEAGLAAFGFTLPITAAMTAMAIGLSIRSNNKIVHRNCTAPDQLPREISNALTLAVIITTLVSIVFLVFNSELLVITGNANWLVQENNASTVSGQSTYLQLRYLGWVFMVLVWQANAILRALGWMTTASLLMFSWMATKSVIAILFLVPQSPLYVNGFISLGYVHLFTDLAFAVISLSVLHKKVGLKLPRLRSLLRSGTSRRIDGCFVVAQQFITPISMAALTAIAARIDTSYVAALALLFRLEVLFLLLPMVLTTSMPAIVGANYWLGHKHRVKQFYKFSFSIIVGFQLIVALFVYTQSHFLSSFICPHDAIASHLNNYLHWVPWGYGAAGIAIVFQSCLNAKNQTLHATFIGIAHRLIAVLPLTVLGAVYFDEYGFYQGMMFGHILAIIPVLYFLYRFGFIENTTVLSSSNNQLKGIKHES